VIALWLGHEQVETTQVYLHADLALKERALARTTPLDSKPAAATARQTRSSGSWMDCDEAQSTSISSFAGSVGAGIGGFQ
jgi:hypothetical protein